MKIERVDHIQLAMPQGEEAEAIVYYSGLLGIPLREKPEFLKARGGVWFETENLKVHLGVEFKFTPAKKAHPAFIVSGLEELATILRNADYEVVTEEPIDGKARFFTSDPFGNRIEFMEAER